MLSQSYIKLLLALTITLTVLVAWSTSTTVCGEWYKKKLQAGNKLRMRAVLAKREQFRGPGRILGKSSTIRTTWVKPGLGACGFTYTDDSKGACLWTGLNMDSPLPKGLSSGWLTGAHPKNCKRELFINRKDIRAEGRALDGCPFSDTKKLSIEEGCSTIWVTRATFIELGGDPKSGVTEIDIDTWDFKKGGQNPPN
ncbi:hypothetical protein PGT21_035294 [Puccinia graminis f. sp. tritici]|uniref:Uncharacterized protein n=1 Tax=Puccinia graminis f. sp. tritici TaxID=56615 RepID=A0A5B0Q028_PUCGR|nr:hypothetical protein PGT21_035294 [Puccinia graminis f. sp. tritici]KAA1126346.1 hypothetical protein PGTUg99_027989 [Puccinia graminis f. sp. tritici]